MVLKELSELIRALWDLFLEKPRCSITDMTAVYAVTRAQQTYLQNLKGTLIGYAAAVATAIAIMPATINRKMFTLPRRSYLGDNPAKMQTCGIPGMASS